MLVATALLSCLALWLLINLTHVAAHLVVARVFAVAVDRVSLGIGPTLWSRRRGRTTVRIALLPVALLVRLRPRWTPDDDGVWPPTDRQDLRSRSLGVRSAVFLSAPLALLVLALVSAFIVTGFERTRPDDRPVVGGVAHAMPAAEAGIHAGDVILAVDGTSPETWSDVVRLVSDAGEGPVSLEVERDGRIETFDVEPDWSPVAGRPMIGIAPGVITIEPPGLVARAGAAITTVTDYFRGSLEGLTRAPTGTRIRAVSGPIAITSMALEGGGSGSRASGFWLFATYFMLSCVAWCAVLPYLDGRRLLFVLIEAVARRPIHPKHEQRFNLVWLAIVVVLNVVVSGARFLL
jgi:regulator of sigma E protease